MRETFNEMLARHRREREELETAERAEASAAMHQQRLDAAAEETRRNEAALQARIDAAAADPAALLLNIAEAGVAIHVDDDDRIVVTPARGLNLIFRSAIAQRRDRIVELLKQRQQPEIL
jgi:hypothetical protein